jgi:hypothetical protein
MFDERLKPPAPRWISVIFLQGEKAEGVLGMIDRSGATAAIEYLQRWDFGEETTEAALTNGYVYDRIPAGSTDLTIANDDAPYALTFSKPFGYVSLLRRYSAESELEPVPASSPSASHAARGRRDVADTWVAGRDRSASYARHAVAL